MPEALTEYTEDTEKEREPSLRSWWQAEPSWPRAVKEESKAGLAPPAAPSPTAPGGQPPACPPPAGSTHRQLPLQGGHEAASFLSFP